MTQDAPEESDEEDADVVTVEAEATCHITSTTANYEDGTSDTKKLKLCPAPDGSLEVLPI